MWTVTAACMLLILSGSSLSSRSIERIGIGSQAGRYRASYAAS